MSEAGGALERVRAACLALPETSERLSHGSPAFFIRGTRSFLTFQDDHHGDGRLAIWCAAPEGMQEALVEEDPEHYFRPPYVGVRGWLGVRLDRGIEWERVAEAIETAYLVRRPRSGSRSGGPTR